MVGTHVDGKLIGEAKRTRSRIRFAAATRADDAAIRQLLRATPMHGAISLTFEREPDYFRGANLGGAKDDLIVAFNNDQLVCIGRCSTRNAWINGQIRRTGYLAELRLEANARGRFDILRDGYRFFRSLQQTNPADVYFSSIAEDNTPARRLLERGLPALPRYTHAGDLTTVLISTNRHSTWGRGSPAADSRLNSDRDAARLTSPGLRGCRTARGSRPVSVAGVQHDVASAEELASFLNEAGSQHQFAAAWTPEALHALSHHDLPIESFTLIRKNGTIVAAGALWDQRCFRQTVVRAYSPLLRHGRPLINLFGRGFGYPPLPKPGHVLSHAFVSPLGIRAGHDELLPELISGFCRRGAECGIDYLTFALPSRDPRLTFLQRRFCSRAYRSRIYRVEWAGMPRIDFDQRTVFPDVALL
jgi:hypothetical protein